MMKRFAGSGNGGDSSFLALVGFLLAQPYQLAVQPSSRLPPRRKLPWVTSA